MSGERCGSMSTRSVLRSTSTIGRTTRSASCSSRRPGTDEIQLDLLGDYKSNVALYPTFQHYFRNHKPRFLAVWGKNDPFFLPRGAEDFRRDIPGAMINFFDTGHFALE